MNNVDLEVLKVINAALNETGSIEINNWKEVLNDLQKQAVFCLPYDLVKGNQSLTSEEKNSYKVLCYQNIANTTQVLNEQQRMLELFDVYNIPVVILKGAAAAMYYPHPEYRSMGDIDIIVKPDDFDKAFEMLGSRYSNNQTLKQNPRHAGFISKSGVEIELHKYFSFGKKNDLLDQYIYSGIDNREWHDIKGHSFPTLPPVENGLVILNHVYQHLSNHGVGYRQLIDFREFVNNEVDNLDAFLDATKYVGLFGLAKALIVLCDKYLNLNVNNNLVVNDELVDQLMEIFVNEGNFGRKEPMTSEKKSEIVIQRARNPLKLLATLQSFGRIHWKATEKYVFLRPFAWLFQIGYYINQVRINGGISIIAKGQKRIDSREKLFNELGL